MADQGKPRPTPVRFFLELTVVLILAGFAARRIFQGWQGPFKPLKGPETFVAEPLESERRGGPVAGSLAPPKPVHLQSRPLDSLSVKPEKGGGAVADTWEAADDAPVVPGGEKAVPKGRLRGGPVGSGVGHSFYHLLRGPEVQREVSQVARIPESRRGPPSEDAPRLFDRPSVAPDALALARSPEETGAEVLPWLERLKRVDRRIVLGAIVALFLALYAIGVKALRRGPGGRGFTHD